MKAPGNQIYYFGDLDYEGIGIYERLEEEFHGKWEIIPFVRAYEAMLNKAGDLEMLPETKEKQNRNISQAFFHILKKNRYRECRAFLRRENTSHRKY